MAGLWGQIHIESELAEAGEFLEGDRGVFSKEVLGLWW